MELNEDRGAPLVSDGSRMLKVRLFLPSFVKCNEVVRFHGKQIKMLLHFHDYR